MKRSIAFSLIVALLVLQGAIASSSSSYSKMDSHLVERLQQQQQQQQQQELGSPGKTFNVFVVPKAVDETELGDKVQGRLGELRSRLESSSLDEIPRAQRRGIVHEIRSTVARFAQEGLLGFLGGLPLKKVESLWITNAIYVSGASREIVEVLAAREDVAMVYLDRPVASISPVRIAEAVDPAAAAAGEREEMLLEWGVTHIGADKAWNITRGEGVVVAIIDTGVRSDKGTLLLLLSLVSVSLVLAGRRTRRSLTAIGDSWELVALTMTTTGLIQRVCPSTLAPFQK